jgi:hypothetical protein
MKKYVTLAALLTAGTAFANATTVELITSGPSSFTADLKNGTTNISLGGWDNASGRTIDISASDVMTYLGNKQGWILGCGTMNSGLPEKTTFGNTATYSSESGAGFSITGRPAYRGEYTALVLNVSDLFSGVTDPTELTSISLSFNSSGATAGSFSVWSISTNNAIQLGSSRSLTATSNEFSVDGLSLSDGKIAFLFSTQNQGGGTQIKISNFKGTATVIPEPSAFGMLAGVGALALVASRRRRTQKI